MPYPLMLHGKHHDSPVTYDAVGEWLVPWRISSVEEEYRALTSGAALLDCSTQALIEVRGEDRVAFLHNLLSQDIARVPPGHTALAALLTPADKLITDVLVLAEPQAHWLLCDAVRAIRLLQELERYRFSERVQLIHHERLEVALAIQGPRALELLAAAGATELPGPHQHLRLTIAGLPARLIRHGLVGQDGVLCLSTVGIAQPLWQHLREVGEPAGLRVVGWEAFNLARIEAGVPWFGIDMDETHLLDETGLTGILASDAKGCYVGQEIVARMATYGAPSKKLVGLMIEGNTLPQRHALLLHGQENAGWVTSACRSPALGRLIGMGYVQRGAYGPGTQIHLAVGMERIEVTVVERPIVHAQ
jgi:folate-binding protein YgfZ